MLNYKKIRECALQAGDDSLPSDSICVYDRLEALCDLVGGKVGGRRFVRDQGREHDSHLHHMHHMHIRHLMWLMQKVIEPR